MPFFDDANAIIFLAPISAFDQVLAEDRSVNRLEDSVMLWKQICQNKLLEHIELILFLNKIDVFRAKLPKVPLERYFSEHMEDKALYSSINKQSWFTQLLAPFIL